jgi:hypothetical protein
MLRLTGARLATLRRVVAMEGAVPLLSVAAVAIGTGFAGAAMFATEAQQHPMVAPGAAYYLRACDAPPRLEPDCIRDLAKKSSLLAGSGTIERTAWSGSHSS